MCYSPWKKYKAGSTHYVESKKKKVTYPNDVWIACGKCVACKRRRVEDWVIRLEEEAKVSVSSYFVTLTYKDQNLPWSDGKATLYLRDLQLFFKRLRQHDARSTSKNKKESEGRKIKYYAVGEYGGRTDRPHYHAIIYNVLDVESIHKAWTLGLIHIGEDCNANTMAYCAKYIEKESVDEDGTKKKFSVMSNGLGKEYLTHTRIEKLRRSEGTNYINRNGHAKALPRYYKKKVWSDEESAIRQHDAHRKAQTKIWKKRKERQRIHKEDIFLHEAKARRSMEENLKLKTLKRN